MHQNYVKKPFRYSINLDKILINPNHNDFKDYNIKESIAHEINYCNNEQNRLCEIFSNIETIYLTKDKKH